MNELEIKHYRFTCPQIWEYEVAVDKNGAVISTNKTINGRIHWAVGKSLDRVKKYYNIPNIVNSKNPFQVTIEEIL